VRRLHWLVAGAIALLACSIPLLGRGAALDAWLAALAAVSACAVVFGVRLNRARERWPWIVAAAGVGLLALAQVVVLLVFLGTLNASYPGPADAFRLAAYPAFAAALLVFVRRRTPAHDWGSILDAAVVAIGVASVLWALVLNAVTADPSLSVAAKVVSIAYPVAGIALLGLCVRLLVSTGLRVAANALVGAATVVLVVTDGLYVHGRLDGWYEDGGWLDFARTAVPLLWAVAALDVSMRRMTDPVEQPEAWPIRRRVVLLGCGVATTSAMVAVDAFRGEPGVSGVTVIAAIVLLGVISARMANLVVAFDRSVAREAVLQSGAAALVTARTRDEIRGVVEDTAQRLAGGKRQAFVQVELGIRPSLETVTDAVVVGDGLVAATIRGEVRRSGALGRLGTAKTLLAPIARRDQLQGLLRVTGTRPLPWHLHQGLDTLASQAALALESADQREDLFERSSEARFRTLVQNSKDVIAVLEPSFVIRYVTPSVEEMLGWSPGSLVQKKLDEVLDPDEPGVGADLRSAVGGEVEVQRELRLLRSDGIVRTVECVFRNLLDDPSVRGIVMTAHDVTERRQLEDELTHQAFHDALTGLPNRLLLTDRIEHALERARRSGSDVALLFLDIDDFKTVNDSLGHTAGDELLVEIGSRLRDALRVVDTAARLGGDEFALLLEDAKGVTGATTVAERVLDAVAVPLRAGGTEVLCRASIGIVFGEPGQSAGELLRNADVAMYRAKQAGGHRFQLFEPRMHEAALTRLELKADLERAFAADELDLNYQPLIDLQTGRVVALEALLRWCHPIRGFISPLEFIPIAEETGLINDIGAWVLRRACRQTREWQVGVPGYSGLAINVNLSARQILQPTFRHSVAETLAETGIHPTQLVLEITESTLMEDVEGVSARLAELRALGIRIAIDDFGTGFSSLGYLQRFPVDELKVAREFVDAVVTDPRQARLVEAIVALARSLELETVAEGIEEEGQHQLLRQFGCRLGQGYLYSRPLPAADVPGALVVEHAA
jgi:diguanylate cyclase (GGDEF)-like protein/PAS domain S-box-containing protein